MAKEEEKEMAAVAMSEVIEKANKAAGYDIAPAFAVLSAMRLNEQLKMDIPLTDMNVDVVVMADIVNRATGGTVYPQTLGMLMELCIAYGWHWRDKGESLLRSEAVGKELMGYVDGRKDTTIEVKKERKEGIAQGLVAVAGAVEVVMKKMNGGRER